MRWMPAPGRKNPILLLGFSLSKLGARSRIMESPTRQLKRGAFCTAGGCGVRLGSPPFLSAANLLCVCSTGGAPVLSDRLIWWLGPLP